MVPSTLPLRLLAGLLLAALGFAVLPGSAAADPTPSLGEVQRRVDALNKDAADAAERYNTAKVQLTETNRKMRSAQNRYAVTKRHLDAMKALVGRIAVASYKSGGLDPTVALVLSEDPQTFLRQAADLSQVTRHQSAMLQGMEAAQLQAAVDRKAVADQKARAGALQDKIATEKDAIESRLAEARDLLARLEAKQRARFLAMQQAATQRALSARSDAPRASRSSRDSGGGGGERRWRQLRRTGLRPRGRGRPDRLRAARRPLRLGRRRPRLLRLLRPHHVLLGGRRCLAAALVVRAVRRGPARGDSDLQPGDLVFYYSPISHVGIYIGGGKIIDAPYPGLSVHISGLNSMPLVGAGRP